MGVQIDLVAYQKIAFQDWVQIQSQILTKQESNTEHAVPLLSTNRN